MNNQPSILTYQAISALLKLLCFDAETLATHRRIRYPAWRPQGGTSRDAYIQPGMLGGQLL